MLNCNYKYKFGKSLEELSIELNVCCQTIVAWRKNGFDIFKKAEKLNYRRKNKEMFKKIYATLKNIKYRCTNKNDRKYKYYGEKGIKNHLTIDNLTTLWIKNKAYKMKQPSIDRIDSDKNYTLSNCRFIEMEKNRKTKKEVKNKKYLGRLLKKKIKEAGLSQRDFSVKVGVTDITINRWANNGITAKKKYFPLIEEILGEKIEYIKSD